jgi:hypothetical protein
MMFGIVGIVGVVALLCGRVGGTELTFELKQRERMCFYEEVKGGEQATLEYQVSLHLPAGVLSRFQSIVFFANKERGACAMVDGRWSVVRMVGLST